MEPVLPHLTSLSERQYQAVTSDPSIPLQILAGPGSGKTRVLTSRIVHIIEHHGILPNEICAVTFTNKSATEMKVRLTASIGPERTSKLILGTFHATCVRYLRRYAAHIDLPSNFTVQDQADGQKLVKSILSSFSDVLDSVETKLDAKSVLDMIGKAKSLGETPMSMASGAKVERNPVLLMVSRIYAEYESKMKAADALDFEDLLLRAAELFKREPWVLGSIKHIFVDEFQDTNVTQYGLLKLFAKASGCVTIVGDPDQSIYGWRNADIENLSHMVRDFPKTKVILLEDNFRSTGSILAASYAIISQDQTRHAKGLIPFHASGSPVVLKRCATAETEATLIASEIKRVKICTGLEWSDFAVLLRYGALSRPIEQAFQRAGIPNRMAAGHKFFDRAEIKTVLGYLQLADNPNFSPAFARVVNVPKRGIGEKTLENIVSSAQAANVSPVTLSRRGKCTVKISTTARSSLDQFLKVVDKLKQLADEGKTVGKLIEVLLREVDFEKHWKDDKWEDRLENIMELVNYSTIVSSNSESQATLSLADDLDDSEELREIPPPSTPLRVFLEASMLSTDMTTHEEEANVPKVVISTVHAAKGLEWPVVFVPAVEAGIYPFYRCEEEKEQMEERRLLYVAMTRAQALLYTSYTQGRMSNGQLQERRISPFLPTEGAVKTRTSVLPTIDAEARKSIMHVLGRPPVDEAAILVEIEKAGNDAMLAPEWNGGEATVSGRSASTRGGFFSNNDNEDEFALPPMRRSTSPGEFAPPSHGPPYNPRARSRSPPPAHLGGFSRASSLQVPLAPSSSNSRAGGSNPSALRTTSNPNPSSKSKPPPPSRPFHTSSAPRRKLVDPPPMKDPPKHLPLRLATTDRYSLPPMNANTTSSADPSTLATPPVSLDRFTSAANSSLEFMKNLGLPGGGGGGGGGAGAGVGAGSSTDAGAGQTKKRLGMGRPMVPWGQGGSAPKKSKP